MVTINQVKADDKSVEGKYNFFADSIQNAVEHIGKLPAFPIENHLSLIEKMSYQLKWNEQEFSKKYIQNHLKSPLLDPNDIFVKKWLSNSVDKIYNHDHPKLSAFLDRLIKKLKENLLKWYVYSVTDILKDNSLTVNQSRNELEYYSVLIVAEYLFNGFSKKDIETLPVRILAPFVKGDSRPVFMVKHINSTYKKATFENQLYRIKRLCFKKKLRRQYVIRIKNIYADHLFKIEYENIILISASSQELRDITPIDIHETFIKGDGIYAYQNMEINSVEEGFREFIGNVKRAIDFINSINKQTFAEIDYEVRHVFDPQKWKGRISFHSVRTELKQKNLESLTVFQKMDGQLNSKAAKSLHELDKTYFQALSEVRPQEKILLIWRFLESLFSHCSSSKIDCITKQVPQILMISEDAYFRRLIKIQIFNSLNNHGEKIGIDFMKAGEKYVTENHDLLLEPLQKNSAIRNHPFLSRELKKLTSPKSKKMKNDALRFYRILLMEGYEQRNFLSHNLISMDKALLKLNQSFPPLIKRLRKSMIEKLMTNENPSLSLEELLKDLSTQGNKVMMSK